MILYTTKETFERYKLKTPEEMQVKENGAILRTILDLEKDDRFLHWGGKLFCFDRRKCLQVVHFESKLTFVLADLKVADFEEVANLIVFYLHELYKHQPNMLQLIDRMIEDTPALVFDRLKDRSIIAKLNGTQHDILLDGYVLYDYIEGNTLNTRKLNNILNRDRLFCKKQLDGKDGFFTTYELFGLLLQARYADNVSRTPPFRVLPPIETDKRKH